MKRRQKRKLAVLILLVVLLAAVGLWYWNFRATGAIALPDMRVQAADVVPPPTFLFAFSGASGHTLVQPVGLATHGGDVYVTDAQQGLVFVFRQSDGHYLTSFGKGHLQQPIQAAFDPIDGNLYVSDRTEQAIEVFTPAGKWVKTFDPNLPMNQRPKGATSQWDPSAIAFAPDGTMYVVELLNGQRFLIFGPDGKFQKSVGTYGLATTASSSPQQFQFPSSIKYENGSVYVSDSNNRRVQVFAKDGTYQHLIAMSGLPRGMTFLPADIVTSGSSSAPKFAIVDTLSHLATVWDTNGKQYLTFGSQGSQDGQFNYPSDIALGDRGIVFITDTYNQRVQAWGWTQKLSPLPEILPRQPAWYLVLLPLLLFAIPLRKRKVRATADFVQAMYDGGLVPLMAQKRVRWLVSTSDYEKLKDLEQDGIELSELLEPTAHSDTDAYALGVRYNLDDEHAAMLAFAQRAKSVYTDDPELVRLAKLIEVDTIGHEEFVASMEKTASKKK